MNHSSRGWSKCTIQPAASLVREIPRIFERASPLNFLTHGSFIHINQHKNFRTRPSFVRFATQKPWVSETELTDVLSAKSLALLKRLYHCVLRMRNQEWRLYDNFRGRQWHW